MSGFSGVLHPTLRFEKGSLNILMGSINSFYKLIPHDVTRSFGPYSRQEVLSDSKRNGTSGRGQEVIMCKLSHFEPLYPVLLPFGYIGTKVLLYFPTEALCLSISLRVIGSGEFLFDAQKLT